MDLSSLLLRRWRRRRDEMDAVSSAPTVLPPRSLRPPKAAFHMFASGRGVFLGIKVRAPSRPNRVVMGKQ